SLEDDLILPVGELNRLRRFWVDELLRLRTQPRRWTLNNESVTGMLPSLRSHPVSSPSGLTQPESPPVSKPELIVLVRSMDQLEAALACGVRTIYCEFENGAGAVC
ncbi:MAG: U32 family peptidase, partial [Candidatus Omnitrophica bacterium]|nr:U32 family peptidase [Candidatus Omnitrophota bacterium]